MESGQCAHQDIRHYNHVHCCLSCGETVCLPLHKRKRLFTEIFQYTPQSKSHGLTHTYDDLRLSTGLHIRLINLLPGSHDEPIFCTIVTVNPHHAEYEALSYTWASENGDDRKSGRVHCPDGVIPVTENCEAVLRLLRPLHPDHIPRILWVDSICINQSNTVERNHQVGLMDQIYQSATDVVICIQDPSRDYTDCMRWLKRRREYEYKYNREVMNERSARITQQIVCLLRNRYFSRVWVGVFLSTQIAFNSLTM